MKLLRRRRPAVCEHLEGLPIDEMPDGGCVDCLAIGATWVHLRYCVSCGEVRCCDTSVNQHARHHAASHDHPVARSHEPGENWAWCYVHEAGIDLA